MQSLPVVMCFHLKRFEQASTKIDTFVEFPDILHMSPYLSSNILRKRFQNATDHTTFSVEGETYELFAVVNHHGNMDNGHYICFVRHAEMWFKCDDAWITKSSLQQVFKTKGYLLFYLRKNLQFGKS